jgi:FlaA1/EpsC-like NDP-sugar epimerase
MLYKIATTISPRKKQAILLFLDLSLVIVAFFGSEALLSSAASTPFAPLARLEFLIAGFCAAAGAILHLGLHRMKLNAYEAQGMTDTVLVAGAVGAACGLTNFVAETPMRFAEILVVSASYLILMMASRLMLLRLVRWIWRSGSNETRVLIYGAGQTGRQLAAALATDTAVFPVAFVDDNPRLQSLTIAGLRVHSPVQIAELVERNGVDRIVLAMPSVGRHAQMRIQRKLQDIGCEVQSLPSFADLVAEGGESSRKPAIDLAGLMGRNRLEEELPGVSEAYVDRSILVTGAGGSIGSELCRQLTLCDPAKIVLIDHSELALYNILKELKDIAPNLPVVPILGSVCQAELVRDVLSQHDIDIVLHAAAYKHVPLVQMNAVEGVRNNVLGTKTVAEESGRAGVERFILVSSDKAVRPTSIMGATKRMAEQVVQDLATRSKHTRFSMVRFGNVMGSSGSVIPLFEEQISRGGPVTVTDRRVTRFFMTVSEAVRLVLLAGSFARGGDVFVLDMGEPVPILNVARQMIEGAGYSVRDENNPDGEIEIQLTGLRPGEKLHEELLIGSDMLTTPHTKILRADESHLSEIEMAKALNELRATITDRDPAKCNEILRRWVEVDPKLAEVVTTDA